MRGIVLVYVRTCDATVRCNADTVIFISLYIHVGKRKAGSLQVQRSPILPPCVSQFYARLRFSATTSSTDNHCPAALQRCQGLLNGTLYGYSHRPAMCVSLSMNASCCASVLPSTHDYGYRVCDTSTTASRIAPARPKMLSIALVINPRRACAARVTVLGLSFRPSVCLSVCYHVFCHYAQQGSQKAISTGSVPHYIVKMAKVLRSKVMA